MNEQKNRGAIGPHANQPVLRLGPELSQAAGAIIFLHGRGARLKASSASTMKSAKERWPPSPLKPPAILGIPNPFSLPSKTISLISIPR